MECDDMKKAQCDWSSAEPRFEMSQAHIVMWEECPADGAEGLGSGFGFTPLDITSPSSGFAPASTSFCPNLAGFGPVQEVPTFTHLDSSTANSSIGHLKTSLANENSLIGSNPIGGNLSRNNSLSELPKQSLSSSSSSSSLSSSKSVCTAELVRKLVLDAKKGPASGNGVKGQQTFQGYASKNSSNANASSSTRSAATAWFPVGLQAQVPHLNLPNNKKSKELKSARKATVVELDKKQNDERLKRVRKNLLRLKQERNVTPAVVGMATETSASQSEEQQQQQQQQQNAVGTLIPAVSSVVAAVAKDPSTATTTNSAASVYTSSNVASAPTSAVGAVNIIRPITLVPASNAASAVAEKSYLEAVKPFLKKPVRSTEVTGLLQRVGKESHVFKGYASKRAAAATTTTATAAATTVVNSNSVTQSRARPVKKKIATAVTAAKTKAVNQLTLEDETSDLMFPIENLKMNTDTDVDQPKKLKAVEKKSNAKTVAKGKTNQPKKGAVSSIKKATPPSPKKLVSFSPARSVRIVATTEDVAVEEKSSGPAVQCIQFEVGSPPMKRPKIITGHIIGFSPPPKPGVLSPARHVPAVTADVGMKRHLPSHVLKRLVSPPHGKTESDSVVPSVVQTSSGNPNISHKMVLVSSLQTSHLTTTATTSTTAAATTTSTTATAGQKADESAATRKKEASPDRKLGLYLAGGNPTPKRKRETDSVHLSPKTKTAMASVPYSKRIKLLTKQDK